MHDQHPGEKAGDQASDEASDEASDRASDRAEPQASASETPGSQMPGSQTAPSQAPASETAATASEQSAAAEDASLAGAGPEHAADKDEAAVSDAKPSRWSADEALTAINAGLKAELEETKSQLRYMAADLENTRKRSDREKADMARFAISKFAEDILPIADTIQRAMALVPADALANDEAMQRFVDGVMMIEGNLLTALERHGVVKLNPLGEKFDPNRHQAVMEDAHPEIPKGHVSMVHQAGYMISDRVLRTAMVTVSNGVGQTAAAASAPVAPSAPAVGQGDAARIDGTSSPRAANDDEAPGSDDPNRQA